MEENFILTPRKKLDYAPDKNILYDVIIIGGGVAGFSAAMYAKRLGMGVLIIGDAPGGTIMLADKVENWPGIISVTGQRLANLVETHAKDYEIDVLNGIVNEVKKNGDEFEVGVKEEVFKGKTIIFATGTRLRRLGVKGEGEFAGKGVSYCALCDAGFFKDKIVGVVGGSDSAVKEALFLSEHVKKVYIIYRKEKVRAEKITSDRMEEKVKKGKIEVINNANVLEILGDKFVNKVLLDREFNGSGELELQGLFIDIGREPLSDLAKSLGVEINEKGEIEITNLSETNVDGVFAAGDVTDFPFKQAITGSSQGVTAVWSAYKFLEKQ
jgi:thioredoxin reductase (NADPH)